MNTLILYRKRARMRQFDLARQLGVTEQLISKWETERSNPTKDQAIDMARILGVNPEDLFPDLFIKLL